MTKEPTVKIAVRVPVELMAKLLVRAKTKRVSEAVRAAIDSFANSIELKMETIHRASIIAPELREELVKAEPKIKSGKPHKWEFGHAACFEVDVAHKNHTECCYCK